MFQQTVNFSQTSFFCRLNEFRENNKKNKELLMSIDNLKLFCKVIEEGSISQAARASYVSQPAVTKRMRQLENLYGVILFDRQNGLVLTTAGETLYCYAKEIIELYSRSIIAVKQTVSQMELVIDIGASLTIGEYLLPKIIGEYQKKHPHVYFNLQVENTPNIVAKLESNDINLAFVEGIVESDTLYKEKIAEDELILVCAPSHPWNEKTAIEASDLINETMIWRERNASVRKIIENCLQRYHVLEQIKSKMELGSTQAIKTAVEEGLGVAILPKLSVNKEIKLGLLSGVRLSGLEMKRDLWILKKESRFPNENAETFIHFIKKYHDGMC